LVTKAQFNEHLEKAAARLEELRKKGDYSDAELAVMLRDDGFWPTAITKLLKISGHEISKATAKLVVR